jgi:hypothetical protein
VLAGLAVQETQLLERLAENVFAAHFVLDVYRVCERFWFIKRRERARLGQMIFQWPNTVIRASEVSKFPCSAGKSCRISARASALLALQIAKQPQPDILAR